MLAQIFPPEALEAASDLVRAAGLLGMSLAVVLGVLAAYLVAKAHHEGYARFSLRGAVTWYARVVLLGTVLMIAAGLASALNLAFASGFGPGYSYREAVTSADYDTIAYRALVVTGSGILAYLAHQGLRRLVEPNAAARPAQRFFVVAQVIIFGLASVALLVATGVSLVTRHVGAMGEEAAGLLPGSAISGLLIALVFWLGSIEVARRQLRAGEQPSA